MGNDKSIEEQLELGVKRCAAEGWAHRGQYSDRVSASRYARKNRDEWAQLLARLADPDVSVLWLWESSRGDRKLSSWAGMLETCRDNRVKIHVETHGRLYDMANARDWRTLAEDGVDSAYESDKVSGRTKRSAMARAAQGRPHSGAGYGYRNQHDTRTGKFTCRVIEPSQARNVAELFARLRQGHSLRSIERDWAARGILTPTGKPFSARYLRHLALTAAYAGLRVHLTTEQRKADPYSVEGATEGDWPAIVDRATFFQVREMLTAPERKTSRPGRAVHLLSVSTAARCGVCDGPLTASNRQGVRDWSYFCAKAGHVRVNEAELDAVAEDAIISYLSDEANYSAFATPDSPELVQVRADLARVRSDLADLADAVTKRGKSPAWAMQASDEYESQIAALEKRERDLTAPGALRGLISPGRDVAERWLAAPMSARRRVAEIVLAPGCRGSIRIARTLGTGARRPAAERVTWVRK
jgi:DNA invertase Pin-like site-specific DNA recombinase